jgi:hypothetical protein
LINWIILNRPQHSYLLGWERTCPVRKSFYKSNSIRTPWSNSDTGASVKPVRRTSLTSVACRTSYKSRDRSDRSVLPGRLGANFECQQKACRAELSLRGSRATTRVCPWAERDCSNRVSSMWLAYVRWQTERIMHEGTPGCACASGAPNSFFLYRCGKISSLLRYEFFPWQM